MFRRKKCCLNTPKRLSVTFSVKSSQDSIKKYDTDILELNSTNLIKKSIQLHAYVENGDQKSILHTLKVENIAIIAQCLSENRMFRKTYL